MNDWGCPSHLFIRTVGLLLNLQLTSRHPELLENIIEKQESERYQCKRGYVDNIVYDAA